MMFYNVILLYLIITVCFLPGALASNTSTDVFMDDSIVAIDWPQWQQLMGRI